MHGRYEREISGMDGPFTFAGKTLFDGERHLWFGGWMGSETMLPRELYLSEAGELCMRPMREARATYTLDIASGVGFERADITLPEPPYRLSMHLMGVGDAATLTFASACHLEIYPHVQKLCYRSGNTVVERTLLPMRGEITLDMYITERFAELFVDDRSAFSFPISNAKTLAIRASNAKVDWRITSEEDHQP